MRSIRAIIWPLVNDGHRAEASDSAASTAASRSASVINSVRDTSA
jgi:hypothetical protein